MNFQRPLQNTAMLLLTALLLAAGCKSSEPAARTGPAWERLGERMVDFRGDRDVIAVTADRGTFKAIKLRVNRAPIFLNAVTISYGNGNTHRVAVNRRIQAGHETRPANLPGEARVIRKVAFTYRSAPRARKKAHVVLLGRH